MVNRDQILALQPAYRAAYQDIVGPEKVTYVSLKDVVLNNNADSEPWRPESVLERLHNFDSIQIELIDDKTNLNLVRQDLITNKDIGLVLLGRSVSRYTKPQLIVITTNDRLYAIEPSDNRAMKFLENRLYEPNLTFWTTNGVHEAACLKHQFGINLLKLAHTGTKSNARCCTGLHVHLFKVIEKIPKEFKSSCLFFPERAKHLKVARLETFENLVEIWLDIPKTDIIYRPDQLEHLAVKPLGLTASNIIKKRCVLVRELAMTMSAYATIELDIINKNVIDCLKCCNNQLRNALRKVIKDSEAKGFAHFQYFAHYSGIVGGTKLSERQVSHCDQRRNIVPEAQATSTFVLKPSAAPRTKIKAQTGSGLSEEASGSADWL